ncbi:hypothetical protein B0T10DRAFT_487201 [Thelonectria olida]|uniref:Uncharacterized protein n=1 Tax=Thelonectria olida TaxID=1576542 RepID=A0A9P8W5G4_9HYPO|nr:hypothetical protein B0T10DRAFT_487201 [Thelonectria olida]
MLTLPRTRPLPPVILSPPKSWLFSLIATLLFSLLPFMCVCLHFGSSEPHPMPIPSHLRPAPPSISEIPPHSQLTTSLVFPDSLLFAFFSLLA